MLKRNEGCCRETAAALAHAMRAKNMWQADAVQRRKQQEPPKPGLGYYHRLPWQEQEALIFYSHKHVREFRKVDAADSAETVAYQKAKVKTSSEEQLLVCDLTPSHPSNSPPPPPPTQPHPTPPLSRR